MYLSRLLGILDLRPYKLPNKKSLGWQAPNAEKKYVMKDGDNQPYPIASPTLFIVGVILVLGQVFLCPIPGFDKCLPGVIVWTFRLQYL